MQMWLLGTRIETVGNAEIISHADCRLRRIPRLGRLVEWDNAPPRRELSCERHFIAMHKGREEYSLVHGK